MLVNNFISSVMESMDKCQCHTNVCTRVCFFVQITHSFDVAIQSHLKRILLFSTEKHNDRTKNQATVLEFELNISLKRLRSWDHKRFINKRMRNSKCVSNERGGEEEWENFCKMKISYCIWEMRSIRTDLCVENIFHTKEIRNGDLLFFSFNLYSLFWYIL